MASRASEGIEVQGQYSLVFVNNSTQEGTVCVYQQDPNITNPDVMSLAWFAKPAAPTTTIIFTWGIDYDFVWSETGVLRPGVLFVASQTWPTDLSSENQVTFTNQDGAYTFADQQAGPQAGSLYITEDGTIPPNQASVGIGMSGFGTFAVQAQPNMNLVFTPNPQYWVTFGSYTQGEVMDISEVNNPAEIVFPPNVYSMTATLGANNEWTVAPTFQVNARLLEARREHPEAAWGRHA